MQIERAEHWNEFQPDAKSQAANFWPSTVTHLSGGKNENIISSSPEPAEEYGKP